jgi:hypothetical protein
METNNLIQQAIAITSNVNQLLALQDALGHRISVVRGNELADMLKENVIAGEYPLAYDIPTREINQDKDGNGTDDYTVTIDFDDGLPFRLKVHYENEEGQDKMMKVTVMEGGDL